MFVLQGRVPRGPRVHFKQGVHADTAARQQQRQVGARARWTAQA